MKTSFLLSAALMTLSCTLFAQGAGTEAERINSELEGTQADLFQQLDQDGDGRISKQEAARNKPLLNAFDDLDHDDDNHLRAEEISDWQAMDEIDSAQ